MVANAFLCYKCMDLLDKLSIDKIHGLYSCALQDELTGLHPDAELSRAVKKVYSIILKRSFSALKREFFISTLLTFIDDMEAFQNLRLVCKDWKAVIEKKKYILNFGNIHVYNVGLKGIYSSPDWFPEAFPLKAFIKHVNTFCFRTAGMNLHFIDDDKQDTFLECLLTVQNLESLLIQTDAWPMYSNIENSWNTRDVNFWTRLLQNNKDTLKRIHLRYDDEHRFKDRLRAFLCKYFQYSDAHRMPIMLISLLFEHEYLYDFVCVSIRDIFISVFEEVYGSDLEKKIPTSRLEMLVEFGPQSETEKMIVHSVGPNVYAHCIGTDLKKITRQNAPIFQVKFRPEEEESEDG